MPFTLSHSAAALPFLKSRNLSATGLIVGTMVPDFEYFFRLSVKGIYGHTLAGIFYFDIPVAIALAFVFHNVAKQNLIDHLPVFLQSRFKEIRSSDFNQYFKQHWIAFIISVVIGTTTHIVLDSFTHGHQYMASHFYPDVTIGDTGMPLWKLLQQISSVVGMAFLAWYVLRMKQQPGPVHKPGILYWVLVFVVIIALVAIRVRFPMNKEPWVTILITMIAGFCLGITILGLIPFKRKAM